MVNSRMHSLTFTRIFYSKSSLVSTFSTHKKASENTREKFNMNPGEKQAEIYTYEAPWLIYACNWSVRRLRSFSLRVYCSLYRSFSLSNSLFMMRWNSNREPLFILRNGSKLYPRCCLLYTLYTSDHSRAFQLTPTNALPFSHSFVR